MPKTVQNGPLEAENEGGWGGKRKDGVVRVVEDRILPPPRYTLSLQKFTSFHKKEQQK